MTASVRCPRGGEEAEPARTPSESAAGGDFRLPVQTAFFCEKLLTATPLIISDVTRTVSADTVANMQLADMAPGTKEQDRELDMLSDTVRGTVWNTEASSWVAVAGTGWDRAAGTTAGTVWGRRPTDSRWK